MTDNMDNLRRAIDDWNRGNLDRYLEVYDDSIQLHGYSPTPMDKTAVRGFYSMILAAFPGSQLAIDEQIVEGDRVALRFTQTGVHKGDFMGVPATGRDFVLDGQTVMHFREGRIVERWSIADMLGLLVQLGAVPPPM
jgi:steroid delta-isomerase-like uncharacterized protein